MRNISTRHGNAAVRGSLAASAVLALALGLAQPAVAQELPEQPAGEAPGVEVPAVEAPAEEAPVAEAPGELGELLDRVGEVAQEVAAKNEEVKAAEDDLAKAEEELKEFQKRAEVAKQDSESASVALARQQENVNGIAQSRYRGVNLDPLTTTLASGDPQSAVDRLGYLGAISRDAQRNLSTMAENSRAAADKKSEADGAVKLAADKAAELEAKRASLAAEKEALETQQREIEAQVDALTPEQRSAWENQFDAADVQFDLEALSKLGGSGGAAVSAAMSRIGSPYGWGATGPNQFDCSGLMVWSYAQQGKTIPRTSQAQIAGGTPVPLDQLQPGDIIGYFPGVTHVGMYIGNGQVVHASTYGVPVQVVPLHSMQVTGAVRY